MPRPAIPAAFAGAGKAPSSQIRSTRQVAWGDISITVVDDSNGRIDPQREGGGEVAVFPSQEATPCGGDLARSENDGGRERRRQPAAQSEKTTRCTRVIMKDRRRKDFNYNRVKNVMRRRSQIDELDRRLRKEKESSRRLKSAVAVLTAKLNAAEAGRRRSNGLERAFFSHLVETEALILQREMLVKPGAQPTRAERMEAARSEAHKSLVLVLRRELEANSPWRISAGPRTRHPAFSATSSTPVDASISTTGHKDADTVGRPYEAFGATDSKTWWSDGVCGSGARRGGGNGSSDQQRRRQHQEIQYISIDGTHKTVSCWDSETPAQAYRRVAGKVMQRLSSALFGQELLALETAKTSTAEREKMLEEREKASFESQFSLQVKKEQLENSKSTLRSKVHEAQTALQEAREANKLQRDLINDAYGVESHLRRSLLSMQVARDHLSETVVQHLQNIQTAVDRRTGFVPRSVQRAINDLVAVCSATGTSELTIERSPA